MVKNSKGNIENVKIEIETEFEKGKFENKNLKEILNARMLKLPIWNQCLQLGILTGWQRSLRTR